MAKDLKEEQSPRQERPPAGVSDATVRLAGRGKAQEPIPNVHDRPSSEQVGIGQQMQNNGTISR